LGLSSDQKETDLEIIAKHIASYPKRNPLRPRVMVITNSENAVVLGIGAFKGKDHYSFSVKVEPVDIEKLLDSNGAGDSFVGGFLSKIC
jgi:adenosine kinase